LRQIINEDTGNGGSRLDEIIQKLSELFD